MFHITPQRCWTAYSKSEPHHAFQEYWKRSGIVNEPCVLFVTRHRYKPITYMYSSVLHTRRKGWIIVPANVPCGSPFIHEAPRRTPEVSALHTTANTSWPFIPHWIKHSSGYYGWLFFLLNSAQISCYSQLPMPAHVAFNILTPRTTVSNDLYPPFLSVYDVRQLKRLTTTQNVNKYPAHNWICRHPSPWARAKSGY